MKTSDGNGYELCLDAETKGEALACPFNSSVSDTNSSPQVQIYVPTQTSDPSNNDYYNNNNQSNNHQYNHCQCNDRQCSHYQCNHCQCNNRQCNNNQNDSHQDDYLNNNQ